MMRLLLSVCAVSGRWAPPIVLLFVWTAIVLSGPGTTLANIAAMFLGVVIATLWLCSIFAAMVDTPTRDALAARAGSAGKLHLHRLSAVVVVMVPASALLVMAIKLNSLASGRSAATEVAYAAALCVIAIASGLALGALLSAPLIERRSAALFLAIPALIGLAKIPVVESVLLAFSRDQAGALLWLLVGSVVIAALISGISSRMVTRRSAAASA